VAAREQNSGVEASIQVKPSYGLTDDAIARMLQDSFAHAQDDMAARALAEAQVEADQIVDLTQNALAADGDCCRPRSARRSTPCWPAWRSARRHGCRRAAGRRSRR